jgi:hypothetical protein
MIRRSTWLVLLLFLVVLGGGLYFQKYQSENQAQITPTAQFKLFLAGIDKNQITGFSIESSSGQKFSAAKGQDGNWSVAGFTAADTDLSGIDDMLTKITSLSVLAELSEAPEEDVIGLAPPVYVFKVTLQNGTQQTALLGTSTPTKSGYYARLEEGSPVVLGKYAVDNLLTFLEHPPIATPIPTETSQGVVPQGPQP